MHKFWDSLGEIRAFFHAFFRSSTSAIMCSEDPDEAIAAAIDALQRLTEGESKESIAANYGISMEVVITYG